MMNRHVKRAIFFWVPLSAFIAWITGFASGWWWVKGHIDPFPTLSQTTRLLIVSPHPDDETLLSAGLIQRTIHAGGTVMVIFLTNGDAGSGAVVLENKRVDGAPQEFLRLGEERMQEALEANARLGVSRENLIFLGFPDQGLEKLISDNANGHDTPIASKTTRMTAVPYREALYPSQEYLGVHLIADLKELVATFHPTIVVTTHPRDKHPDHRAASALVAHIRTVLGATWPVYTGLVHYRNYPGRSEFLFPPKKLFGSDWVSFSLTEDEQRMKSEALSRYKTQLDPIQKKLFTALTARNEIFEREQSEQE